MNSRRTLTYFHSGSLDSVRAPQTRMPAPGEPADDVHPAGVEHVLRALVDVVLEVDRARDRLVGGGLEHAAVVVGEGVDAADRAAGRDQLPDAAARVADPDPGVVERAVLGVVDVPAGVDATRRWPGRRWASTTANRNRFSSQWVTTFLAASSGAPGAYTMATDRNESSPVRRGPYDCGDQRRRPRKLPRSPGRRRLRPANVRRRPRWAARPRRHPPEPPRPAPSCHC